MSFHELIAVRACRRATAIGSVALMPVLAASVADAQLQDVEGSQDPAGFKRYEGSTVIAYESQEFTRFDLLLGPVKDGGPTKRNVLTSTKSEQIEGRLTRVLYVAPEGRAPLEVLRNYEQELQAGGFDVLFRCAGLECGSHRDGWLGRYFLYPQGKRLRNTPPGGRNPGEISYYSTQSRPATSRQWG